MGDRRHRPSALGLSQACDTIANLSAQALALNADAAAYAVYLYATGREA